MGVFETPQDSRDWAEKKHLLRYCHIHNTYFDPSIGCKDCGNPIKPISKDQFDPLRMCHVGYKYYAGCYWKKISFTETYEYKETFTDSCGVWGEVAKEEATYELMIKEPRETQETGEAIVELNAKVLEEARETKEEIPIELNIKELEEPQELLTEELIELKIGDSILTTKRVPIWAKLYPPVIDNSGPSSSTAPPTPPQVNKPAKNPKHPSFGEDLKRMIFGK